jgi:hypothetical protein
MAAGTVPPVSRRSRRGRQEREVGLDGSRVAAEDESQDCLDGEAKAHDLFAADGVHEQAAAKAAREIKQLTMVPKPMFSMRSCWG